MPQGDWMRRYLFEEMAEAERVECENAYLNDTEVFHEIAALESDIIDDYVLGELSTADRQRFERSLPLNPERRRRVEIARALLAHALAEDATPPAAAEPEHDRWPSLGLWRGRLMAAGLLCASVGLAWSLMVNRRLVAEQEAVLRRADELRASRPPGAVDAQQAMKGVVVLAPAETIVRGSAVRTVLSVPRGAVSVLLRLQVGSNAAGHYDVSIRASSGDLLWRQRDVEGWTVVDGGEVAVIVPLRVFASGGDYVVRIYRGSEDPLHSIAGYMVHIERP
jgi:anti-sigma factor RsiW